jgi:hypothetical protein
MAMALRIVEVEDHMESSIDALTSAIRSVSERIDRHWESLNAHQREMRALTEKREWISMVVVLLGTIVILGVMARGFKWL